MLRRREDTRHARLPMMLFLGVIAFPIIAGVVGATPLPDDLLGVQQQLIASKTRRALEMIRLSESHMATDPRRTFRRRPRAKAIKLG